MYLIKTTRLLFSIYIFLIMNVSFIAGQTAIKIAFNNLVFNSPVDIQNASDGSNRIFVVEQKGIIKVFNNEEDIASANTFLNIEDKVLFGGEQGLLGMAFHPDYKNNGYFYMDYTASNPRRTVISRFSVLSTNKNLADENSEVILLEVEQPYSNHNGGQLAFGPDGYLYVSLGDGGSAGDPDNNGQNLSSFLGSIIRIDVNQNEGMRNYSIPSDNPFVNNTNNYREEIFAYGLRNVWRFSFDKNGNLWAADVGQNKWEEINIIEKGKNYGWRIMEGSHCYNPSDNCNQNGLELPVWEYDHSPEGGYSITGGFVYEGINAPGLINKYIYADFVNGNMWTLELSNSQTTSSFLTKFEGQISTFGIDENKELYFSDYSSGKIYKFIDESINPVGKVEQPAFQLFQNYPNPFNPSTTIKYSIHRRSVIARSETTWQSNSEITSSSQQDGIPRNDEVNVTLKVYDILGNEIATLVDEEKSAGNYQTTFNTYLFSHKISSGIYYYQLKLGNNFKTRKMTLLN